MSEEREMNDENASNKIDAIKQLIFGENIQHYDAEFAQVRGEIEAEKSKLQSELKSLREDSEKMISALRTEIEKDLGVIRSKMEKEVEKLANSKTDRQKLGNLFEDIAKKLKA